MLNKRQISRLISSLVLVVLSLFCGVLLGYLQWRDWHRGEQDRTDKTDPWNAICKMIMDDGYCSATIVGPRRSDGRWHVVSAAHCLRRVGQSVQLVTRSGISINATCVAINRTADCAILVTEHYDSLPYCLIADAVPPIGSAV
jgi:hypothetical protein